MGHGGSMVNVGFVCLLVACATFTSEGGDNSSGGPTGAPTAAEDCFDGQDDNGDGKRDCEEPTCASFARCVPAATSLDGFSGYFTLVFDGGECPATVPTSNGDVWAATADPPRCGACKCDASITCTGTVSAAESPFAGCNPIKPITFVVGECDGIDPYSGGTAVYWEVGGLENAKCTPSSDSPMLSPKFTRARLCSGARVGAGCQPGNVCGPANSGASSAPSLCIARPHPGGAALPCPPAFPSAHLVVPTERDPETSFTDTRGCDPCKCTGPKGASCNSVLSLFSDKSCQTLSGSAAGSACSNVSCGGACQSGRVTVNPVPGTCTASGGSPLGGIALAGSGQQLCCDR